MPEEMIIVTKNKIRMTDVKENSKYTKTKDTNPKWKISTTFQKRFFTTIFCFLLLLNLTSSFYPFPSGINRLSSSSWSITTPKNEMPKIAVKRTKSMLFQNVENSKNMDEYDEQIFDDDEKLLQQVSLTQLKDLCRQYSITTKGSKETLLARLRSFAQEQAALEQERRKRLVRRVEQGIDDTQGNGKAKYKTVSNIHNSEDSNDIDYEKEEDSLDGVFYFSLPNNGTDSPKIYTATKITDDNDNNSSSTSSKHNVNKRNPINVPPPPPGLEPNEKGERVVTVYSTTDQNDLTGMTTSSQSPFGNKNDVGMMGGYSRAGSSKNSSPEETLAGGPFGDTSGSQRKKASEKEMDAAKESIYELVFSLLAMTGAPGFKDDATSMEEEILMSDDDADRNDSSMNDQYNTGRIYKKVSNVNDFGFVGFDSSRVPSSMLTSNSKALRAGNGEALQQVLSEFEMQAIGYDGMSGDDKTRGGGHYLEVRKVGTFLEGFRKAEVRRVSRETATMLLDKLVNEGVNGLDQMLSSMTKGSDESNDAGELNDSLVLYLEDAIKQQEKKVEAIVRKEDNRSRMGESMNGKKWSSEDDISSLWNVTKNELGEIIETLDPNDPKVKKQLEKESLIELSQLNSPENVRAKSPSEQLLILLTLLKERIKAEAVFTNDENGRNLRVLAYCLHASSDQQREKIIYDNFGSSLDRLDLFYELLLSSIEYAESTSHQLQPSRNGPLNVRLLQSIKDLVQDMKEKQVWKASGLPNKDQDPFWQ
jgi:hypothetical protein